MGISLKRDDLIFLDTAPFIYFFEENEEYFPAMAYLFEEMYASGAQAITSIITYIELTSKPSQLGNTKLARKYRDYLTCSEGINLFPLDLSIADHAVTLRAAYDLKTPDAIQLATALSCGADYIISNDRKWKQVKELNILMLNEIK